MSDAGLIALLQHQRRQQRDQIGVAATLTQPVDGALHLPAAGGDGGERVCDRVLRIIMGMDAEPVAGDVLDHGRDDLMHLVRQCATIGVAEHDPTRAGVVGGLQGLQGVGRVGLVAVEEVFGVEQSLLAALDDLADGVADHRQVFIQFDAERRLGMAVMGLADQADGLHLATQGDGKARVVAGAAPAAAGHAEGGQLGAGERWRLRKERVVGRVGARPTALDIVDAQLVERPGNGDLV